MLWWFQRLLIFHLILFQWNTFSPVPFLYHGILRLHFAANIWKWCCFKQWTTFQWAYLSPLLEKVVKIEEFWRISVLAVFSSGVNITWGLSVWVWVICSYITFIVSYPLKLSLCLFQHLYNFRYNKSHLRSNDIWITEVKVNI